MQKYKFINKSFVTLALLLALFSIFSLNTVYAASFSTWTQRASALAWRSVACSFDCGTAYSVVANGKIWKSINGGASWSELSGSLTANWISIATSENGVQVFAAVSGGSIYRSTDSGNTWSELLNSANKNWKSITSSSNGSILLAAVSPGALWVSTDSGGNWSQISSPGTASSWTSVDIIADGSVVAASNSSGGIWLGTGTVGSWGWVNVTTGKSAHDGEVISAKAWKSITLDSTGTKIAAVANDLYFSSNSGTNWRHATGGNYSWISVSGTSDLKTMMMLADNGVNTNCRPHIVTTTDYITFSDSIVGLVWVPYSAGDFAKDGTRAIALTASSFIYTAGDAYIAVDTTPPTFSSSASFSISENIASSSNAATIKVSESATVTISSGADAARFNIVASDSVTALIRFKVSPDFEAPADVGGNNVYEITLTATDAASNAGTQSITITVTDVVDTSSFNSFALAGGVTTATFRGSIQINASVTVASRITFRAANMVIPGCKSILASGSGSTFTVSCSWKPSKRGAVLLTASSAPTSAGITGAMATPINLNVINRSGRR